MTSSLLEVRVYKSELVIDKVCIRYKYINSASSSAEFDQLHPYKYSVADGSLGTVGQYWSSTKAALTTAHLPVGKEGGLLVRFGYVQKAWWSWVEFNPAKLQEEDFTVVGTCLSLLYTNGGATLLQHGQLARLDAAFDVRGTPMQDYFFLDSRLRTSNQTYVQAGSLYLGSERGKKSTIVYDKRKEQWDKAGIALDEDWLRIETRLSDPGRWHLKQIHEVTNPFANLLVIDRKAWAASDGAALKDLRMAVAAGVPFEQAFWHLPLLARKQVLAQLQGCKAAWWDPVAAWQGYAEKLDWMALLGMQAQPPPEQH